MSGTTSFVTKPSNSSLRPPTRSGTPKASRFATSLPTKDLTSMSYLDDIGFNKLFNQPMVTDEVRVVERELLSAITQMESGAPFPQLNPRSDAELLATSPMMRRQKSGESIGAASNGSSSPQQKSSRRGRSASIVVNSSFRVDSNDSFRYTPANNRTSPAVSDAQSGCGGGVTNASFVSCNMDNSSFAHQMASNSSFRSSTATPAAPAGATPQHADPTKTPTPTAAAMTKKKSGVFLLDKQQQHQQQFGLDNYGIAQDHFNGAFQSFMSLPVISLNKTAHWERYAAVRQQMVDETSEIAAAAFVVTCLAPEDPDFLNCLPPESRGNEEDPTTRQQLEAMFHRCGSSLLYPNKGLFVHCWKDSSAAKAYSRMWERIWHSLFAFRIEGVFAPPSIAFNIQGVEVTVMALPPVYVERQPPFRNVLTESLGGASANASVVTTMARRLQLVASLDVQHFDLYLGIDGRAYLMFPRGTTIDGKATVGPYRPWRHELYMQMISGCNKDAMIDSLQMSPHMLEEFVEERSIPMCSVKMIAMILNGKGTITAEVAIGDALTSALLHSHGVNCREMFTVKEYIAAIQNKYDTNTMAADPPEFSKFDSKQIVAACGVCQQILVQEMVGRALKEIIKIDNTHGAGIVWQSTVNPAGADRFGFSLISRRLDVVNRVARLAVGRSEEFRKDVLIPVLRRKFNIPTDFDFQWEMIAPGTTLKVLSIRLGVIYSSSAGRFDAFSVMSSKKLLLLVPPKYVDTMLKRQERQTTIAVQEVWNMLEHISPQSPLYQPFLIAAMNASCITNCLRAMLTSHRKPRPNSLTVEKAEIAMLLATVEASQRTPESLELLRRLLKLTADLGAEQQSEIQSFSGSSEFLDNCLLSIKLLHAATLFEIAKQNPDINLYAKAISGFIAIPHVDFVFSATHSQALRDIESLIPVLSEEDIEVYLMTIVEPIAELLKRWNRQANAARYMQRCLTAMMKVTAAERSPQLPRTCSLNFKTHLQAHGAYDHRTHVALYLYCLFTLTSSKVQASQALATIHALRKVIDKASSLPPSMQLSFGYTFTVQKVLRRAHLQIAELKYTREAAEIRPHVLAMGHFSDNVLKLQALSRAFMHRRYLGSLRANSPKTKKYARPQTPNFGAMISNDSFSSPILLSPPSLASPTNMLPHSPLESPNHEGQRDRVISMDRGGGSSGGSVTPILKSTSDSTPRMVTSPNEIEMLPPALQQQQMADSASQQAALSHPSQQRRESVHTQQRPTTSTNDVIAVNPQPYQQVDLTNNVHKPSGGGSVIDRINQQRRAQYQQQQQQQPSTQQASAHNGVVEEDLLVHQHPTATTQSSSRPPLSPPPQQQQLQQHGAPQSEGLSSGMFSPDTLSSPNSRETTSTFSGGGVVEQESVVAQRGRGGSLASNPTEQHTSAGTATTTRLVPTFDDLDVSPGQPSLLTHSAQLGKSTDTAGLNASTQPPPSVGSHGTRQPTPQIEKLQEVLQQLGPPPTPPAVNVDPTTQQLSELPDSHRELFLMCDGDNDGFVGTEDCVHTFLEFGLMSEEKLRLLFAVENSKKKKKSGEEEATMNPAEFSRIIQRAGLDI